MTAIHIYARYSCSVNDTVELPEGKTWNDVTAWYIKHGTLYLTFNDRDDDEFELHLEFDPTEGVDWKYPEDGSVTIHPVADCGDIDYETKLVDGE